MGLGPVVATVEVTPATVTFDALGAGRQLTAVAKDVAGAAITGKVFGWRSSDQAIATVDNTGLVEAVDNGSTSVIASTDGVEGTAAVTVQQVVAQVEVEPPTLTLAAMEMAQLTAEAQDWLRNAVAGAVVTWESSDPQVVEVSGDGTVTALADGSVTITATSNGFSGWAGVAVGPVVWEPTGLVTGTIAALDVLSGSGDILAATIGQGVLRSTDGGDTWNEANTGLTETDLFSLAATSIGDVFVSGTDLVFRSTNGGASWTNATAGLNGSIREVAVGPGDVVYAGTSFGLYRSDDNGDTWTISAFINDVDRVATNSAGDIFVGTELSGLFRSTDGGVTWTDLNGDFPSGNDLVIFAIGVDPVNDDVFTCCPGGLFRSTDSGNTWTDVTNGIEHVPFRFVFDNGDVYAGTCEGGVYRSTDRGGTWLPVNAGLPSLSVFALTGDGAGGLLAGTLGDGVLRSVEPRPATVGPLSPKRCDLG